jgi:hypothetical protein
MLQADPVPHPTGPGFSPPPPPPASSTPSPVAPPVGAPAPTRTTSEPNEPQNPDEWLKLLVSLGWEPGRAEELALQSASGPVRDDLREALRADIDRYYGPSNVVSNAEAAKNAWHGTGFVPRPDLPPEQRPRPNGTQVLRYCARMNWAARGGAR